MTVGSLTYKGLAVPLNGESEIKQITAATDILTITGASSQSGDFLVCRDSDGNEVFFLEETGECTFTATQTASGLGALFVTNSTVSSGVGVGLMSHLTLTTSASAAQHYAGWFYLDTTAKAIAGGREAVLNLFYDCGSSALGAMRSFINFDDAASDVQALFTFANIGLSGGCIIANAASAATHGIRVYIGNDPYYIMATSCTN